MFVNDEIWIKKCLLTLLLPFQLSLIFEKVKPSVNEKAEENFPRRETKRRIGHDEILSGSRGKIEKYGKPRV